MHRKQLIKNISLTAASLALLPAANLFAANLKDKVKLVMIDIGLHGLCTQKGLQELEAVWVNKIILITRNQRCHILYR